jgi:hypothetical protein
VAAFGLVMASIFNRSLHGQLEGAGLAPAVIAAVEQQRNRLAAIELPASVGAEEATIVRRAIAEAFVTGFRWIMLLSAALALASAASAWGLIGSARERTRADGSP